MDRIDITYYTDPLCCWSWALEPQWRRLIYEFNGMISWRYCMTGMIPSWDQYNDAMHSVSRPIQMGPVWMHASQLSGMPMNSRIWMENPPASSYPACLAFKCAEMQSKENGDRYLRLLREAIMLEGKNIAKPEVLHEIALALAAESAGGFNAAQFSADLKSDEGMNALRKDINETNTHHISRFPTLIFRHAKQTPIIITGYRPYAGLLDAMKNFFPALTPVQHADVASYKKFWGTLTSRELQEAVER
jgi:predicted DsbA family dithiol-disulfide isomerase